MTIAWAYRVALATALLLFAAQAGAQTFHREQLRIPWAPAGPRGLEALLVRPEAPGKYPLVLISHGVTGNVGERKALTPWRLYPMALEFARRGWAAVVVLRRGYGESGGNPEYPGACSDRDYVSAAFTSARDLKAAIEAMTQRPDIDSTRILAVGQSGGGIASIALAAGPPPGLRAVISFAGGRGGTKDFKICREDRLIYSFGYFGTKVRTPMLWVYAENDKRFWPALAQKFHDAYAASGAPVEFIKAPAFENDGHGLFSLRGIPIWSAYIDTFLAKHGLTMRTKLLPLPTLAGYTPPRSSASARKSLDDYRRAGQHKAFAINDKGGYGWTSGRRSTAEAESAVLTLCSKHGRPCRIILVNDAAAKGNER